MLVSLLLASESNFSIWYEIKVTKQVDGIKCKIRLVAEIGLSSSYHQAECKLYKNSENNQIKDILFSLVQLWQKEALWQMSFTL